MLLTGSIVIQIKWVEINSYLGIHIQTKSRTWNAIPNMSKVTLLLLFPFFMDTKDIQCWTALFCIRAFIWLYDLGHTKNI